MGERTSLCVGYLGRHSIEWMGILNGKIQRNYRKGRFWKNIGDQGSGNKYIDFGDHGYLEYQI